MYGGGWNALEFDLISVDKSSSDIDPIVISGEAEITKTAVGNFSKRPKQDCNKRPVENHICDAIEVFSSDDDRSGDKRQRKDHFIMEGRQILQIKKLEIAGLLHLFLI